MKERTAQPENAPVVVAIAGQSATSGACLALHTAHHHSLVMVSSRFKSTRATTTIGDDCPASDVWR